MQATLIGDLENAVRRRPARFAADEPIAAAVSISPLCADSSLPLLIEPGSTNIDLIDWISSDREELEKHLLDAGGILFRGFAIDSIEQFQALTEAASGQ